MSRGRPPAEPVKELFLHAYVLDAVKKASAAGKTSVKQQAVLHFKGNDGMTELTVDITVRIVGVKQRIV